MTPEEIMLGRHSPQGALFRADNLYFQYVGSKSFYAYLGQARGTVFRDEDFAGLYRESWGRPSVPPSQLCIGLLLQAHDGVSDEEAIQRSAYDLRWKVALGLELEERLCAKSTLQLFRSKLVLHEAYEQIFEKSVEECRCKGLLKRKKLEVAIDTTPVLGRGAVKDTFNLVSDQIRRVVKEAGKLKGLDEGELARAEGLTRHFGASYKGSCELDWSDAAQKRAVVGQLVADAHVALDLAKRSLRGYARGAEKARAHREAMELLSELLLQDIEEAPEDGGGPQIRRGTSKNRILSTSDPQMRHGHKSPSKGFDGYKTTVVAETGEGVILATGVEGANVPDREGAVDRVKEAGARCSKPVDRVIGDTAYGDTDTRESFAKEGIEVVAKAPPVSNRGTKLQLSDFQIDKKRGVAICPAGKRSIRRDRVKNPEGYRYVFSRKDCFPCALRSACTTAKKSARMLTITIRTEQLEVYRKRQKTKRFRKRYRKRIVVEHRIARLAQLGIRQARYFGQKKVRFQVSILATVANLGLVAAFSGFRRLLEAVSRAAIHLQSIMGYKDGSMALIRIFLFAAPAPGFRKKKAEKRTFRLNF
jgi:transposase